MPGLAVIKQGVPLQGNAKVSRFSFLPLITETIHLPCLHDKYLKKNLLKDTQNIAFSSKTYF